MAPLACKTRWRAGVCAHEDRYSSNKVFVEEEACLFTAVSHDGRPANESCFVTDVCGAGETAAEGQGCGRDSSKRDPSRC
ncbi:hypothetical protein IscW_ISCW013234 [Ixodes scapularis]|uniref:Uncharacterized protein n=1 Tax=Ixodes scapularis TaxID=6945 RepID=B7QAE2_IXOSC|nr:hypothetical protein IscW_ISCW013234 [Ixodes scapularis]|eukprot:XP_002400530.1 hypothetical protein IscW_ISCW013234 [Ixodes scapularis]